MADWNRAVLIASAALAACGAVDRAVARIQDYQVVRLLSYRTTCDMDRLDRDTPARSPAVVLRFHAQCRNATFYPDGIDIVCTDPDDEQTCRIATRERSFDQLELLRRKD